MGLGHWWIGDGGGGVEIGEMRWEEMRRDGGMDGWGLKCFGVVEYW